MSMRLLPRDSLRALKGFGALLITATFMLSQGISVASGSSHTMPITCKVVPTIEASFPEPLQFGDVGPRAGASDSYVTSDPQIVTVWSNTEWTLKIEADPSHGLLTEWTQDEKYGRNALSSPLQWKLDGGGGFNDLVGTGITVVENQSSTDQDGTTVELLFRQEITYYDVPLPPSSHYRIEVKFTAVQAY